MSSAVDLAAWSSSNKVIKYKRLGQFLVNQYANIISIYFPLIWTEQVSQELKYMV